MVISQNQEAKVGIKVGDKGDFNDINNNNEKKCGKKIQGNSFQVFRNCITEMEMGI